MKTFSRWAAVALATAIALVAAGVPAAAADPVIDPKHCVTFRDGNQYCTALPGHLFQVANVDGHRWEEFWVGTATTRTTTGYVYHRWQTSANGPWSSPAKLGTLQAKNGICVTFNDDGRLELFMQGPQNEVEHIWQKTPGAGWGSYSSLGGGLSSTSGVYCKDLVVLPDQLMIGIAVYGTDFAEHFKRQVAINCCWQDVWT